MTMIQAPNWLAVTGLLISLYGAIAVAGAVSAGARWAQGDKSMMQRSACLRQLGVTFGIGLLLIGFAAQMAGNFFSVEFGAPVVLSWLVLAFVLVVYWMHADLWAEQMTKSALSDVSAPVADAVAEERPAAPVRLVAQG